MNGHEEMKTTLSQHEKTYGLARTLGELLKEKGQTLSVAESCTGGNISHYITLVPGASEYYLGGVASYAVSVKEKLLDVEPDLIEEFGVVSKEVAEAMAAGVKKATGSDFALSTTGLAGPGGNGIYPEGSVYIGICSPDGETKSFFHQTTPAGREENIENFTFNALEYLLEYIEKRA